MLGFSRFRAARRTGQEPTTCDCRLRSRKLGHQPPTAARALLRQLGVLGPDRELDEAIEWFHRHAYDLNLLGNYLAKCTTDHDIRGWQQSFPLLKQDERIHPVPAAAGKRAEDGRRMLRAELTKMIWVLLDSLYDKCPMRPAW